MEDGRGDASTVDADPLGPACLDMESDGRRELEFGSLEADIRVEAALDTVDGAIPHGGSDGRALDE